MLGILLALGLTFLGFAWIRVSYDFRRVLRTEDRQIFDEVLSESKKKPFALPDPWVEFAESVELKSISNPRLAQAAQRLIKWYRALRRIVFLGPAAFFLGVLAVSAMGA